MMAQVDRIHSCKRVRSMLRAAALITPADHRPARMHLDGHAKFTAVELRLFCV